MYSKEGEGEGNSEARFGRFQVNEVMILRRMIDCMKCLDFAMWCVICLIILSQTSPGGRL